MKKHQAIVCKKLGIDCSEYESAEIKQWVVNTIILPGSGQQQILEDIQLLFPQEYGEAQYEISQNHKKQPNE